MLHITGIYIGIGKHMLIEEALSLLWNDLLEILLSSVGWM